jgi:ligand-binding sensor domain-containing protein
LGVGGVAMWDGNEWIDYDESDGLVGPNIRGLAIDSFDNVWVATTSGVSKIGDQTSEVSDIEESRVSVYPNPCNGRVTVSLGGLCASGTITVFDTQGRLLQNNRFLNSRKVNFEIQGEPGAYLIQFVNGNSPQNVEVIPIIKL